MDDSKFTGDQKITLLSAWALIKPELDIHGRNLYLLLYREYPRFKPFFDFCTDGICTIKHVRGREMEAHSIQVFRILGQLIEEGLRDSEIFENTLRAIALAHADTGVTGADVREFGGVLLSYLVDALGPQASNSLTVAFEKLVDLVGESFDFLYLARERLNFVL
ncbi:hemoglobin-3-like [Uranotaenia lowii]|uniref:hemoglobin-3-like n=1 Tax=Uranotaenia lowii TaxID=190385 RepID=UPI002479452C|nr:hemoglobin-3-like [Uranotaenia lowii]